MPELTALQKFNCPACGAEAVWTPSKKSLVCPYCGTNSASELKTDPSTIQENDLLQALRDLPADEMGWAAEKKTVRCQSCNAVSVFDPKRVAQNCDFCGSPSLIALDDVKAPVRPSSLLPFNVADTKVREDIRQWYNSHWFAPNALGGKALTDTLHGIYLPYWTFDAQVHGDWEAEAGTYYYTRDNEGKSQRHVRWEYASGSLNHFFDDLLVPASRGVHPALLSEVEPFPTTDKLVPYDPGYVSGWVVEQYQIDLSNAASASHQSMEKNMTSLCSQQVPGDTQRGLRVATQYSGQTFKHVLLPVWLLSYTYGSKSYQVIVNGYTGKIAGEYPISWVKVMLVTLAVLLMLIIFMSLQDS
jgi:Zn finger protein HypA/HybF involved in hydrogenase expression